jgi:hypothetical protein
MPADAGDPSEGRTAANNATVRTVSIIGPDKRIKRFGCSLDPSYYRCASAADLGGRRTSAPPRRFRISARIA